VVLIHGPRQSGKTTLAREVGEGAGYAYATFDDDIQRAAAEADPVGFVAELPALVVVDEIQRVPALFTSVKALVDRDRRPRCFILTGATNVLMVPKLADSLAGRMEMLRLHPLAQAEIAGARCSFLDALFSARFRRADRKRLGRALTERIVSGGYPAPLARASSKRCAAWYRHYLDALVPRDVRDLARTASLDVDIGQCTGRLAALLRRVTGSTCRRAVTGRVSCSPRYTAWWSR